MRITTLVLFLFMALSQVSATNYYVDAINGNNQNSGLSEDKPWRTLDKANEARLSAGDRLLLKGGQTHTGKLELVGVQGEKENPIIVESYGSKSKKAVVSAPDKSLYTIKVENSNYVSLQNLEIVNTGAREMPRRTGVWILAKEFGISKGISLKNLDIRDVNGSMVKKSGGGSAILIQNEWELTPTAFDGLTIENNTIRRTQRNGINFRSSSWARKKWFPSKNVVIRKNLLEQVPGDGIVPIGCDGVVVEYNLMRDCANTFIERDMKEEAAAGIWPWSCDNAIIRYNEVSDHKAMWDGQGFDADYNCRNTIIEYNYSHDNDGGFILICDAGGKRDMNIGNIDSKTRYNLSIGDAVRTVDTRKGTFSPTIHLSGECRSAQVTNNVIYIAKKSSEKTHKALFAFDNWGNKYPKDVVIKDNCFYAEQATKFDDLQKAPTTITQGNYYLGNTFEGRNPEDNITQNEYAEKVFGKGENYLRKQLTAQKKIAGGAILSYVDKVKIEQFFENIKIKQ